METIIKTAHCGLIILLLVLSIIILYRLFLAIKDKHTDLIKIQIIKLIAAVIAWWLIL